jgi:hypothetical protein
VFTLTGALRSRAQGEQWKKTTLMTALLYPGVVFGLFFACNLLVWGQKSSGAGAQPYPTMSPFAALRRWAPWRARRTRPLCQRIPAAACMRAERHRSPAHTLAVEAWCWCACTGSSPHQLRWFCWRSQLHSLPALQAAGTLAALAPAGAVTRTLAAPAHPLTRRTG